MGSAEGFPSEQGSLLDNEPPEFPAVSPTGDPSVDNVLLTTLASMPEQSEEAQHAAYERLHDDLLTELNTEHS